MPDTCTDFCKIIHSGDLLLTRKTIKRDPSCVRKKYHGGRTPLHFIYDHVNHRNPEQADDRLPLIKELLEHGADINAQAWYSNGMRPLTPLVIAVEKHQINGVKLLLKNGADMCIKYSDRSYTVLHSAVSKLAGSDELVRLLLSHGADPNAYDDYYNQTPLTKAAKENRLDFIKILLEAGARVNHELKYGDSALLWACKIQNVKMMEFLLSQGARLDVNDEYLRLQTPFHAIASFRDSVSTTNLKDMERIVELLVELGVDPNALNFEHNTALHVAAGKDDEYMVRALLKVGASASLNLMNREGSTPLHKLLDNDRYWTTDTQVIDTIAKLLIDAGSDLFLKNENGFTPLSLAVGHGHENTIKSLMAKITGVDENSLKNNNPTSWYCVFDRDPEGLHEDGVAALLGYDQVIDRLIEMGYLCLTPDHPFRFVREVKQPLYCAIRANRYESVKALVEAGCRLDRNFRWYTHSQHFVDNEKLDLRLTCLLWESNDFSTLIESTRRYFISILDEEYTVSSWGQQLHLLIFYFALSIRTQSIKLDLLPTKGMNNYCNQLSTILCSYQNKIELLRQEKVGHSLSIYDILSMKLHSLVKLLYCQENFEACVELNAMLRKKSQVECYEYIIMTRIDLAIERKTLYETAKHFLDSCFRNILETMNFLSFPDEVKMNIMSRMTIRDLKKIAHDYINTNILKVD